MLIYSLNKVNLAWIISAEQELFETGEKKDGQY